MIAALALTLAAAQPFSTGPVPSWVDRVPLELTVPAPAAGASDGTQYLLNDVQTRLGPPLETFGHYARVIVNSAGLDASSQISIDVDPSYGHLNWHYVRLWRGGRPLDRLQPAKMQVLRRETQLESQLYDGRLSIVQVIEDLRVGDIVEYAYTLRGQNPVMEHRFSSAFDVEWSAPLRRLRWRLLCPPGRRVFVRNHGTSIAPSVRETPGGREYVWESRDTPAVRAEKRVPSWHDHWGWVQISEWESWEQVSRWGARLFATRGDLPPDLGERVARWKHLPPAAAVVAALRFVQDEVRYLGIEMGTGSHQPSPPALVFARRFGDCKDKVALFTSILQALGVESEPALVHSSLGRALDAWLPSPFAFDHAVARVRLDGHTYWLDCTRSSQGGTLAHIAFGNFERALVLTADSAELTRIPVRPPATPTRVVHDRFAVADTKGPAGFSVETRYEGAEADGIRGDFLERSRDEVERSYLDFYAKSYPSIRPAGALVLADDREANVLTVREQYTIPEFFQDVDGRPGQREVAVEPLTLLDRLAKSDAKRTAPLAVTHPEFLRHVIEVDTPRTWPFGPDSANVFDEAMRLRYEARPRPGGVTLSYEYQSRADVVPAARLADHRETIEAAWTWTRYVLSGPPGPQRRSGTEWAILAAAGLLLLLSLVGAAAVWRFRARRDAAPPGLRALGWGLPVLAGSLLALTALVAVRIGHGWAEYTGPAWTQRTVPGARFYHAGWPAVRLLELATHVVFAVGVALLWVLLLRRRRRFRLLYLALTPALCVLLYLDAAALSFLPGGGPEVVRRATRDALLGLIPLFVAAPFLLGSRRARETLTG